MHHNDKILQVLIVCSFVRPAMVTSPLLLATDPKPIHFLKAYDDSYSKKNREYKYKDKDEYKDNDKNKDTERTTESLSVCYIFEIGTTPEFQV